MSDLYGPGAQIRSTAFAFCLTCGDGFDPKGRGKNHRYCSRSCWAASRSEATNSNWRGGKSTHPLYHVYNEMLARCTRPTHKRWDDYGGRGITVCDRWREDFWNFVADMGERPSGTLAGGRAAWSLDRIDNDEAYSPENCRWSDVRDQAKNRRRHGYESRGRNDLGQFAGVSS